MTEPAPDQVPSSSPASEADRLAAALLAAHRTLQVLDADPETRVRLQVRFLAICTSLKLPAASRGRGLARLERLITDAEGASTRHPARPTQTE